MRPVIVVTGATGRLVSEAVHHWLANDAAEVVALLRDEGGVAGALRREALLDRVTSLGERAARRFSIVRCDVERGDLGPGDHERRAVMRRATHVVHAAATTRLFGPDDDFARVNLGGTAALLRFARGCPRLRRFVYVSTAYVAGRRSGVIYETDAPEAEHRNPYEASKARAEALVLRARDVPSIVVRPSIVVAAHPSPGSAPTALEAAVRQILRRPGVPVPADGECPLDVVPLDYAALGLAAITTADAPLTGAFHLVAGDRAPTARLVVEIAAAARGVVAPPFCAGSPRASDRSLAVALAYLTTPSRFDDGRARDALDRLGVPRPEPLAALRRAFLSRESRVALAHAS